MKTKELLNVVQAAIAGAKSNSSETQNLLFKDGYLSSWSPALSVSAKLPEGAQHLSGIVNGPDLVRFLSKLGKDEIEIVCSGTEWEITAGAMTASLNMRTDTGIEGRVNKLTSELSSLEWDELPTNFLRALSVCVIPNNMSKFHGIFINKGFMLSTNNFRVNRVKFDKEMSGNIWLSQFSASELHKTGISFKDYALSRRWLYLRTGQDKNGVQLIFACNRLDDTNYAYEKVSGLIDSLDKGVFAEGELPELSRAISLAACFDGSIELSDSDVYSNIISLTFTKDNVTVSSERKHSGAYKEKFPYPDKKKLEIDKPFSLNIPSFFLVEACKYSKHFQLTKVGKPLILFRGDDFVSAVMVLVKE